jgi:hypothetical protein
MVNADDTEDRERVTLHALAWNDDPAKAKGSAHTYAMKYYLLTKYSIDQGEDDPDLANFGAQGQQGAAPAPQSKPTGGQTDRDRGNAQTGGQIATGADSGSTQAVRQALNRVYLKAEDVGLTKEQTAARILEKYGKADPADLSRQEYDEICGALDDKKKGGSAK